MKIYTYHESLNRANDELVQMFHQVWTSHGFDVIVLGRNDAKQHPKYEWVVETAAKLPTVNCRKFEEICFIRWCALAHACPENEYVAFADYDVFPSKTWKGFPGDVKFDCFDAHGGPGMTTGCKADWNRIIEVIAPHHTSDMTLLQIYSFGGARLYDRIFDWVKVCGLRDDINKPLVHYSNGYIPQGITRNNYVKQELGL